MHRLLALVSAHSHTYRANETGYYPTDRSFMCVDLSLAIKIHLIFYQDVSPLLVSSIADQLTFYNHFL